MKASLLFSILTAGVLFFTSSCKEKPAPAPVLPGVVAVPAAEADYAEYMPSISNIMAFDSVDLVARVEGFLLKRNFKDGELVKKGQLLFQIEPEKYDIDTVYIDTPYVSSKGVGTDYVDFYGFLEGMMEYDDWGKKILAQYRHKPLVGKGDKTWTGKNEIYESFERLFHHFRHQQIILSYREDLWGRSLYSDFI